MSIGLVVIGIFYLILIYLLVKLFIVAVLFIFSELFHDAKVIGSKLPQYKQVVQKSIQRATDVPDSFNKPLSDDAQWIVLLLAVAFVSILTIAICT